tara:strand:+ start:1059 stop:1211 length:153 start_codon:yes stop_codon:yes gene_type:complete
MLRMAGDVMPAGFLPKADLIGEGCEKRPVDQYPAPVKPTMQAATGVLMPR